MGTQQGGMGTQRGGTGTQREGTGTQRGGMGTQSKRNRAGVLAPPRPLAAHSADLEDFKAGDIQDAQEGGALAGAAVQSTVEAQNQPAEEALVGGLGQGFQREVSLRGRAHSEGWACTSVASVHPPGGKKTLGGDRAPQE